MHRYPLLLHLVGALTCFIGTTTAFFLVQPLRPSASSTTTSSSILSSDLHHQKRTSSKQTIICMSSSSTSAKGEVKLGAYKNGALQVQVKKPQITDAAVSSAVATTDKKRFKLTPVRFVEEGGTRMGHTIVCDWKATYVKGGDAAKHNLKPGAMLPKADIKGFTLELKEDQPEPMASFARAVATGMGQMETKMFEVEMPKSATIEAWRGVTAKIMLLVKSINIKEEVAVDDRPMEVKLEQARKKFMAKAEQEARIAAIAGYRAALLESCDADTEKMESSVSWAKFGENSIKDYKWNLIQEAIAYEENIDFSEVGSFLLQANPPTYT